MLVIMSVPHSCALFFLVSFVFVHFAGASSSLAKVTPTVSLNATTTTPDTNSSSNNNTHRPSYALPGRIFRMYPTPSSTQIHANVLVGYDWLFYAFSVPYEDRAMIDVTVKLNPTPEDASQRNCAGLAVQVEFKRNTFPAVMPQKVPDASETDMLPLLGESLMTISQESVFCEPCSRVTLNNKDTTKADTWYLLIQTRGGGATTENTTCAVTVYVTPRPYYTFVAIAGGSLGVFGIVVVVYLVRMVIVLLSPEYTFEPWGATLAMILILLPRMLEHQLRSTWRSFTTYIDITYQRWDLNRRNAAAREAAERELITPAAAGGVGAPSRDDVSEGDASSTSSLHVDIEMREISPMLTSSTTPSDASATTAAGVGGEEEEVVACRICRDDTSRESLIQPCNCIGSMAYVHRSCLDQWRSECLTRNPINATRCEVCHAPFILSVQFNSFDIAARTALLLCKSMSRTLLFIFSLWVVIVCFGALASIVSYLSCSADWHIPRTTNITDIEHYILGGALYILCGTTIYLSAYVVYIQLQIHGVPALIAMHTVLVVQYALALAIAVLWSGYFLKFILYMCSPYTAWELEISVFSGVTFLMVLFLFLCAAFGIGNLIRVKMLMWWNRSDAETIAVADEENAEGVDNDDDDGSGSGTNDNESLNLHPNNP
eukprot:PhM_4_TR13970/c1_g1_i12/m.36028